MSLSAEEIQKSLEASMLSMQIQMENDHKALNEKIANLEKKTKNKNTFSFVKSYLINFKDNKNNKNNKNKNRHSVNDKNIITEKQKLKNEKFNKSTNDINKYKITSPRNNYCENKADLLEKKAIENENVLRINGGLESNPSLGKKVSGMLIDAIHAKLSIIDSMEKK